MAGFAFRVFVDFDFSVDAEGRLGKADGQVQAQIRACSLLPSAAAKKVGKYIAERGENIVETLEAAEPLAL